jgi:hypothetical protein
MKQSLFFFLVVCHGIILQAGTVEKTFYFNKYSIETRGTYKTINFESTVLAGAPGEPLLPWHSVVLMLPPGEAAVSMEIIREEEVQVPGKLLLYPAQFVQPLSKTDSGIFFINDQAYQKDGSCPATAAGKLMTQYLGGFALAVSTVSPVEYHPATQRLSYFKKVTVRIQTRKSTRSEEALTRMTCSSEMTGLVRRFAQNPEIIDRYQVAKSPAEHYAYLIVSPVAFKNEFQPLISMYADKGMSVRVVTIDSILAVSTGFDTPEKIRNFIIGQRVTHQVEYVLLAGNPPYVPCRYLHDTVFSDHAYVDSIPADLYYSGLDGNYDANANHKYGEPKDSSDLLPDISVARFTVNDTAELHKMIRKTVSYQTNPVLGEFSRPLLAGEFLYNYPVTYGGDYMDLLVNDHSDNGYFTHGIPSATNEVEKLYDTPSWSWSSSVLLASLNRGASFIHHLGHANTTYMMRLSMSSITNASFPQVNGIAHNYQLLYTQGCYDGAFDYGCIAAKAVKIDNFLVAGVFNSRYGWFNQGTTDGPSQHLEREFVSAIYNDTVPEKHLGTAHMISKIKTAPWTALPGEFEPGAQLWCHYCCNVFGDPALEVFTEEPTVFTNITWTGNVDSDWNKTGNWDLARVPTTLCDVIIPDTPNDPVINTLNATFCHNITILNGGNLTINPGKSMVVYGTVTMSPE